jgi:serpin B
MRLASPRLMSAIQGSLVCVFAAGIVSGCRPDVFQARRLPADVQTSAAAVVQANNAFAADIYNVLSQAPDAPANFFFSPFSVSTLLAMLEAGAQGDTAAELRTAMHATIDSDEIATAYHALLASLDTGTSYGGYTLQIADRVFAQQGFTILPSYLETTRDDYDSELDTVDFADSASAAQTIDGWVASKTGDTVPTLLSAQDVNPSVEDK